jgi:pimeloyl-ACP methyl ester carboxylesterase
MPRIAVFVSAAIIAVALLLSSRGGPAGVSPAPAAAAEPAFTKVVILAAGIDPFQTNPASCPPVNPSAGCYDPYARAGALFQPILALLGCPTTQQGGAALVPCGTSGVAWIPYSYAGLTGTAPNQVPAPYTGLQTGQALMTSAARMQALVTFLKGNSQTAGAQLIVVAHSLGGATAAYYGADNPSIPILTLDSPVNGIWPLDAPTLGVYCNASVGLFTPTQQLACNQLTSIAAATSPAATDLHTPAVLGRMALANQINFVNTADAFVPTWFAVARNRSPRAVFKTQTCFSTSDPIFNHFCIVQAAANDVAAFITAGTAPPLTPVQNSIQLSIQASSGGVPLNGTVIASRLGSEVARKRLNNGAATLLVPWLDMRVDVVYSGGMLSLGALPAQMTNLSLPMATWMTAPTKSCTPANPQPGGQTSCVITLTTKLAAGASFVDQVASPGGGSFTNCTATGLLLCTVASGASVTVQCNIFAGNDGCAAGLSATVTLTASGQGPLVEALIFYPQVGQTPVQTFQQNAIPPTNFAPTPRPTATPSPTPAPTPVPR